ncbi:MAG TPA: hypothetical protein VOA87_19670, partial [Thermoanaerobaculia bacterium]|nr:hypothetical protein [Thermoanaerobaculia bacterium]
LTPARLRPGDTAQLAWRFSGAPSRIGRLRITLEGREEATHAAGKSSTTERSTFLVLPLVDATEPTAIPAGTASLAVSARTMHSFAGRRNRIVWSLKVAGEIRRWPDVDDEFEVAVLPAAVASGWAG